jgi:hypothetical protein
MYHVVNGMKYGVILLLHKNQTTLIVLVAKKSEKTSGRSIAPYWVSKAVLIWSIKAIKSGIMAAIRITT